MDAGEKIDVVDFLDRLFLEQRRSGVHQPGPEPGGETSQENVAPAAQAGIAAGGVAAHQQDAVDGRIG